MRCYFSLLVGFISILALVFLTGCENVGSKAVTDNNKSQIAEEQKPVETWTYKKNVDDLTGNVTGYQAELVSNNTQPTRFSDGSHLAILVERKTHIDGNPANYIYMFLEDGSFSDYQGKGFLATFDGSEIDESWNFLKFSSSKGLIIAPEGASASNPLGDKFINKLKNSKTCRIQVNIDGIGMKTFDFNCAGLNWN